jgi:23S rRNA G2445 N2-methylase RlmL
MTSRRREEFDLRGAILDPGFTPRARDAEPLLDILAEGGELAVPAERALLRLGVAAHGAAVARAAGAAGPPAVVRLLGRLAAAEADPAVAAALVGALGNEDERVRRAAAIALGKARPAEAEEALVQALGRETSASARRALIEALGKVGGDAARAAVAAEASLCDPRVAREQARAALILQRSTARPRWPSVIDASRPAEEPVRVALRCRAGLETILLEELPAALGARLRRDEPGGVRVVGTLRGAPAELLGARTMLSFGFPLEARRAGDDPIEAIVGSLTSPPALAMLRRWTVGPLRYRLAFGAGGKRRATVWRIASEVAARVPELINDPTASPWEALVYEARSAVRVELVPRVADPRFEYRISDVPAASHPTVAAALVRAAGTRAGDVVWDPFVGSGTELCERALAGEYRSLVGSDLDAGALAAARANLDAAGARGATLIQGDASRIRPPGPAPTLIVTNPPLGRRVQRSAALGPLLDRFVEHAAALLAPEGRLSWISPFPARTRSVAAARGLEVMLSQEVDMGGFPAELQVLRRPRRRG